MQTTEWTNIGWMEIGKVAEEKLLKNSISWITNHLLYGLVDSIRIVFISVCIYSCTYYLSNYNRVYLFTLNRWPLKVTSFLWIYTQENVIITQRWIYSPVALGGKSSMGQRFISGPLNRKTTALRLTKAWSNKRSIPVEHKKCP